MSHPKTKREAVERLIEKIESGVKSRKISKLFNHIVDCPLCQYTAQDDNPYDIEEKCDLCCDAFGKQIGYSLEAIKEDDELWAPCQLIIINGKKYRYFKDARSTARFIFALLPVLKQMLKDMKE